MCGAYKISVLWIICSEIYWAFPTADLPWEHCITHGSANNPICQSEAAKKTQVNPSLKTRIPNFALRDDKCLILWRVTWFSGADAIDLLRFAETFISDWVLLPSTFPCAVFAALPFRFICFFSLPAPSPCVCRWTLSAAYLWKSAARAGSKVLAQHTNQQKKVIGCQGQAPWPLWGMQAFDGEIYGLVPVKLKYRRRSVPLQLS